MISAKWQATGWPAYPAFDERRLLLRADLLRLPAARAEAAAGRRVRRARHVALEHDPLRAFRAGPGRLDRHGGEERLRVRVHRRAVDLSRVPISTILPRYMTAMRSEMWRTTERSCAMKRYVSPNSFCSSLEQVDDLRLDRDVERRHGLVEHDQLGIERERAGDADALPLTAGELVREPVRVLGAEADRPQQLLHAQPALAALSRPWIRSGSATISRTVIRGLSDAYGSWKTIWMSRRDGPHLPALELRDVRALEDDVAARRLDELDDRPAERRLAAPGLADDPERLAGGASRSTPSTARTLPTVFLQDAGLDREVLDEMLDPEDLVRVGRLGRRSWRRRPPAHSSRSLPRARRGAPPGRAPRRSGTPSRASRRRRSAAARAPRRGTASDLATARSADGTRSPAAA